MPPLLEKFQFLGRAPKILLLGSGGLSIGQAGEFDYSGTQAVKAMQEEGVNVIVINPNIATVQTNPDDKSKIYLYPVEKEWVEKVIIEERPDAIIAGFGGQTALNCLLQLDDDGILEKYNVTNLGTPAEVLRASEDRESFAQKMLEVEMPIPPSFACTTEVEALNAAKDIGFPVIVRAAYALGGLGSGFASNESELSELVNAALSASPQVLIEKSLKGWKEIEYEVMRDAEGNIITICNMENFDPLGIHTGDSIVIAPTLSLSDDECQLLRNASLKIVDHLGVVGECNVQFALSPDSLEFYVIEVNARLSRSSALASKASGYPIAYIATKVVMGYSLLDLKNPVTGTTYAFFEPALDYITVKIPRWDLTKFRGVSRYLSSTMKSVGEVMSIGRNFPEALQKAIRMVTELPEGIPPRPEDLNLDYLKDQLGHPTDIRLYYVLQAFRQNLSLDEIHDITKIDKFFLSHVKYIIHLEREIIQLSKKYEEGKNYLSVFRDIDEETWRRWKVNGFADEQIAGLFLRAIGKPSHSTIRDFSIDLRKLRLALGVRPVVKRIDTTAAEYNSPSNYLYMSYGGSFDDELPEDDRVFSAIVLGSGAYRIGASVEFDWCAVSCSKRLQQFGWRSIIINCNPETVSTDYNSSDRLYFEELSLERILDVLDVEKSVGVIASMGGQLPNKLALPLAKCGVRLLGHKPETIDMAEDRSKFSKLLDELGIDQPRWVAAKSMEELDRFVEEVGFPILSRPSYVLSGAAMAIAYDRETLKACISRAVEVSEDHPIVLSEFVVGAREIELDGIAKNGEILTAVVSEHIENAGVHSGDATMVVPAQRLYVETVRQVRKAGRKIAKGLGLNGPFNIQFLAKSNQIKVIECNARASRSFPFVSKVVGLNLADAATDIILGGYPKLSRFNEDDLPFVGVKAAMFSFRRLGGADPVLGVEMASTGEVGCIGLTADDALILALQAAGIKIPKKGVLVSAGSDQSKVKFLASATILKKLGIPIYATPVIYDYLWGKGFDSIPVVWPGDGENDVNNVIKSGLVDFVISVPKSTQRQEITHGAITRQLAVKYGCSLLTNMETFSVLMEAVERSPDFVKSHKMRSLPKYRV